MKKTDLHTHSNYCDGQNTPEEMIWAAIDQGMDEIGIVVHGHTAFDESYCVSLDGARAFKKEMRELKEDYGEEIRVRIGVEQDLYSDMPTRGFDYVIGSVHYLKLEDGYYPVDESEESFRLLAKEKFGGDYYALAEKYFEEAATVLKVTGADYVGHLDLITKFNEGGRLFDENDPRYIQAALACVDQLLPFKKPFEINTGAIARGYRKSPYPSKFLRDYIKKNGGRFILSSDAHRAEDLMYGFEHFRRV